MIGNGHMMMIPRLSTRQTQMKAGLLLTQEKRSSSPTCSIAVSGKIQCRFFFLNLIKFYLKTQFKFKCAQQGNVFSFIFLNSVDLEQNSAAARSKLSIGPAPIRYRQEDTRSSIFLSFLLVQKSTVDVEIIQLTPQATAVIFKS